MDEARQALTRIDEWRRRLHEVSGSKSESGQTIRPGGDFQNALDDDLNISAALGYLFESIRETNRALDASQFGAEAARSWLIWWRKINEVLALEETTAMALPDEIEALARDRVEARLAKNWRASDQLRDELSARGWDVRDTKDGQKITRRAGIQP
jgi:cysteinyl-tRNA synthetase